MIPSREGGAFVTYTPAEGSFHSSSLCVTAQKVVRYLGGTWNDAGRISLH